MKQENQLTFEQFLAEMETRIREGAGDEYTVYQKREMKNNATTLDGIVLRKHDEKVAPSIYLNQYYNRYQLGETVEALANEILEIYKDQKGTAAGLAETVREALRDISDKIYFRLVNYDMNRELLEKVPHRKLFDLAVTYYCIIYEAKEGIGSVLITKEHQEKLGVTEEELMQFAGKNTRRLFPEVVRPMEEVLRELMGGDYLEILPEEEKIPIYVLTNSKGINGAACMLYPEVTRQLANRLQSDFYVLPSSIHELIVIPDCGNPHEELCQMVADVNRTQVPQEEVLSDHIYRYSVKNQEYQLVPGTVGV